MQPNASVHETVFVVEAQSGIPVSVAARFQVNALVEQIDEIDLFRNVPSRTFFPVIWFETKFDLADSLVVQVRCSSRLLRVRYLSKSNIGCDPRPRINRPCTPRLARAGNLFLFTAANVDFIDIFLI